MDCIRLTLTWLSGFLGAGLPLKGRAGLGCLHAKDLMCS